MRRVLAVALWAAGLSHGATALAEARDDGPGRVAVVIAGADERVHAAAFTRFLVDVGGVAREDIVDIVEPTYAEMARVFGEPGSEGRLHEVVAESSGRVSDVVVFHDRNVGPTTELEAALRTFLQRGPGPPPPYSLERLHASLGKLPVASVTLFTHSCLRDGATYAPVGLGQAPRKGALPAEPHGKVTVFAATCHEAALSEQNGSELGWFTHHVLNALYGMADGDGNGLVTAREAKRYLDVELARATGRAYARPPAVTLTGDPDASLAMSPAGGFPARGMTPWPWAGPQPLTVRPDVAGARVTILNMEEAARLDGLGLRFRMLDVEEAYRPGVRLPPRKYEIEVATEGYETVYETVSHGSSQPTRIDVALRQIDRVWPRPGHFRDCEECPTMVVIQPGAFEVGCASANDCLENETPAHGVRIGRSFAFSARMVTLDRWEECVARGGCNGYRPEVEWDYRGSDPVINVSWNDALAYVSWLSNATGKPYRLPSEAEWEYAARTPAASHRLLRKEPRGEAPDDVREIEELAVTARPASKNVGVVSRVPPPAVRSGLPDLVDGVWEWLQDCWNPDDHGAPVDGTASLHGDCRWRVLRGGSGAGPRTELRLTARNRLPADTRGPFLGFRVALSLEGGGP